MSGADLFAPTTRVITSTSQARPPCLSVVIQGPSESTSDRSLIQFLYIRERADLLIISASIHLHSPPLSALLRQEPVAD